VASTIRKSFILLIFLVGMHNVYAQPDTGRDVVKAPKGSGLVIPPDPAPSTSGSTVSPSIFDDNFKKPGTFTAPEINRNFGKPEIFANPGDRQLEKLNKKQGEVATAIRKNQSYGDIKTTGSTVTIQYRDHGEPDGDLIQIFVNEGVARSSVLLDTGFQGFKLNLEKGFNKIDFVALNQGTSGPNTAEFEIIDEKGNVISSHQWNLATGFKASIIVVKQ
jgi:hypothetical protein